MYNRSDEILGTPLANHMQSKLKNDITVSFCADLTPIAIAGESGTNRARGIPCQISAENDIDAIKAWLARFSNKKTTFDTYRKEAERLLLWCTAQRGIAFSSFTHDDWLVYKKFLQNPQPTSRWVSEDGRKLSRFDPRWRPFTGPLSESSQRQAGVILNSLFCWLVSAGYLFGNPLALSRGRKRRVSPRVTRYLDEDLWLEVKATVESMPRETSRERERYLRLRWLITLCYVCAVRISEISSNTMGGFFRRRDHDGNDRWWLEVLGKGDKIRIVPATNELMAELGHYRGALGYSQLPSRGESIPLLLPIGGKPRPMTRGGIHEIIKRVFKDTGTRLRSYGPEFVATAELVEQASTHWLRHTAGSHMANSDIDLRHVRDTLGHESISTTNTYLHSTDTARHVEIESKHKTKW